MTNIFQFNLFLFFNIYNSLEVNLIKKIFLFLNLIFTRNIFFKNHLFEYKLKKNVFIIFLVIFERITSNCVNIISFTSKLH